ncbi:MAG: hydrogen gas-evolving membrane-bound hydrogenase subunit E [Akkermansiaceae bacterium]
MQLYWLIVAPLLAAFAAPWVCRFFGQKVSGPIMSIIPFGIAAFLLNHALQGHPDASWTHPWVPAFDINLSLLLDGTSLLFLLLVSFIGGLICIYGGAYLEGDVKLPRFYAILFVFMTAMLGVIAADDIILLFVFWELTSITSFLLVGYKHYDQTARKSALQALIITGAGGLALLAGLILLTQITGTTRISEFAAQADVIAGHTLFKPALILVLIGCFTKSAQVPFHFWLPGAMAAPTPVSAFLHSATMVKAGIILLVKLAPAMAQTDLWTNIITPFGAATMLTGGILAIFQTDLKKLLAYSTISVLGSLVLLIGLGDSFSLKTALFLVLVHGLYKGSLFMVAGTIDHATGTRDVATLKGLGRTMPILAVAACLAALSMSGVPPTLGFISKELLYETKLDGSSGKYLLITVGVLANALGVAVALVVGIRPFRKGDVTTKIAHMPGIGMILPPTLLAFLGIILGLFPKLLDKVLISPAVVSLGFDPKTAKLTLWHGFTPVLALSGLTLILGLLAFSQRKKLRSFGNHVRSKNIITPSRIYQIILDGTLAIGARVTLFIQNGSLRTYLRVTIGAAVVLILYSLIYSAGKFETNTRIPASIFDFTVVVLMCASAIAAIFAKTRITAILCLGGVGYSMAMIFASFSAPDLAITQLLVETLTVVMFSFVIYKIPKIRDLQRKTERRWDGLISIIAGIAMTLVVWKSIHVQTHDPISPGLIAKSATEAYGKNVVNVILVDFRALDTLGEILVLAIAGLGVTALLARKRRIPDTSK